MKWNCVLSASLTFIFCAFVSLAAPRAATVTVTTANDVVDGDVSSISNLAVTPGADGFISLREAISAANNTAGADTTLFDGIIDGTPIVLDSIGTTAEDLNADGDLDITDPDGLVIIGNGESNTIIDGNAKERVIHQFDGDLIVTGLTIRGGNESGNVDGGGILSVLNARDLTLMDCTLAGNSAGDDGGGLSFAGDSTLTLSNCTVTGNNSGDDGGGVHNGAGGDLVAITDSTAISGNMAVGGGGGFANGGGGGRIEITGGTVISGNMATDGGGFSNGGGSLQILIANSTFSGNNATEDGGGLRNGGGSLQIAIINCTISGNGAVEDGGGFWNGGGSVTTTVTNSTISGNTAGGDGGGLWNGGGGVQTTLTNSTVSGNRANGHGGGLSEDSGSVIGLNFVTVTQNIADDDADGTGDGGGIDIGGTFGTPTVNIHNSIVQGNDDETIAQTDADDCGNSGGVGTYVSQGDNAFGLGTGCPIGVDDTTGSPNLGPLQNNGGDTETHALLIGSVAVNFAVCDTITTDQRDALRDDGICDTGAFERGAITPVLLQSHRAAQREGALFVEWTLLEATPAFSFAVRRSRDGDSFRSIDVALKREGLTFSFVDDAVDNGSTYRYGIDVIDEDGTRVLFVTASLAASPLPARLEQNAPNPFNPATTIRFTIPERERVIVDVFDISGRHVVRVLDDIRSAGTHSVEWNSRNARGQRVVSGVYFYRLHAGARSLTRRMVLLK